MRSLVLFLVTVFLFTTSFKSDVHPYHVGSVEINYNAKTKTFQVTGRFFMDDLENAVSAKSGKTIRFLDPKFKTEMDAAIKNYSAEYFKLKVNNNFLKINYIGYQEDKEAVEVFLESEVVNDPKKVEAAVSFIYNYFEDQMNIIHIVVNGDRKSDKLTFPNRYIYQQF